MIDMELQTHRERENLARIHDVLGGPETLAHAVDLDSHVTCCPVGRWVMMSDP